MGRRIVAVALVMSGLGMLYLLRCGLVRLLRGKVEQDERAR